MIFDIESIRNLEKNIIELFEFFPNNTRCGKIIYSQCFRTMLYEKKTRNFFSDKYIIYSLKEILNSSPQKSYQNIFLKVAKKIISTCLGLIPILGSYISVALLLQNILTDISDENKINQVDKYLNRNWKKKKKYKKVKNIVYVDDTSALSKQELTCLQVLSFLVSNKYLVNTAILIAQPEDIELPFLSDFSVVLQLKTEDIISVISNTDNYVQNSLTILNIVGIDYVEKLNVALSTNAPSDKTIDAIVQAIFSEKNIESSKELEAFLNSCSLLFEEFELKDVEYISKLQNNIQYRHLFDLAKDAEIIQGLNFQMFFFIQPFLREYYQKKNYTYTSEFYEKIYNYLEKNYPHNYDDLAVAVSILSTNKDKILSQNILAYYYYGNTMPSYKLNKIINILTEFPLGKDLININNFYNTWNNNEKLQAICDESLRRVKNSQISIEARLAILSFIVRLYYELEVEQEVLIEISKYYRSLLAGLKIFSIPIARNYNYALDFIAFSTCIEDDFPTKDFVQKLVLLIQKADVSKLQQGKYFKYLRLGNAIYPNDTDKAKQLLFKGYELSIDNYYINTLFGINYSATLLTEGSYLEAKKILKPILLNSVQGTAIFFSAQNNYLVAEYLSNSRKVKEIINLLSSIDFENGNSDNCICKNNYVSFQIMSGKKDLCEEEQICREIIKNSDTYHVFYAKHNIVIIYFLTKDNRFWSIIENFKIPYLLDRYKTIFKEKIDFLSGNFQKSWDIFELSEALKKHLININSNMKWPSSFDCFPVLFGLIERWFE